MARLFNELVKLQKRAAVLVSGAFKAFPRQRSTSNSSYYLLKWEWHDGSLT
jgi:hypothetical protein